MTFAVTALRLGSIDVDRSGMVWGTTPGTAMTIPVWGAAIEGNGYRIVVDTGFADPVPWSRYNPCHQSADETMPAALAALGWTARSVDIVINTHLHYDHSENNPLFDRARFFVSQAEWEHAQAPVPSQRWSYASEWTTPAADYLDYTLVAADHYDVLPGLRLIQTPGHTPGHQSVLVDTADGTLCIAGDAACVVENFTERSSTGVTVDPALSVASIGKIARLSERVLMNHDPRLSAFQADSFPAIQLGGAPAAPIND